MTTKGEWIEYTGSDEQIAEMRECFIFRDKNGEQCSSIKKGCNFVSDAHLRNYLSGCDVKEYIICNPHPLADMICQQARTGQPVWVKGDGAKDVLGNPIFQYCMYGKGINWDIPNAEYSFTEFKDDKDQPEPSFHGDTI